jgi:hypothetical protein
VLIRIEARRFRCAAAECPRRIFTERLPAIAAGPWSRRTGRLGEIQRHISGWLWAGGPAHAWRSASGCQPVATPCSGWSAGRRVGRRNFTSSRPQNRA